MMQALLMSILMSMRLAISKDPACYILSPLGANVISTVDHPRSHLNWNPEINLDIGDDGASGDPGQDEDDGGADATAAIETCLFCFQKGGHWKDGYG